MTDWLRARRLDRRCRSLVKMASPFSIRSRSERTLSYVARRGILAVLPSRASRTYSASCLSLSSSPSATAKASASYSGSSPHTQDRSTHRPSFSWRRMWIASTTFGGSSLISWCRTTAFQRSRKLDGVWAEIVRMDTSCLFRACRRCPSGAPRPSKPECHGTLSTHVHLNCLDSRSRAAVRT